MFETSSTGEPNRIIRPASAGRCGPSPTGANRESPSGHRERSRPRGAPPLRRAPPPQSWSPVDQPLVPSQAAPIDTAEDLLQELPELPFTHKDHLRFNFLPAPGPKRTTPETWNGARTLRTGRHTYIKQYSTQPESVQSRNTARSIHHGRPAASRLDLSVNNPGVHSWVDSR